MNLARILVLVVALVAGGAAAYLAMNMINRDPEVVQVAAPVAPTIQTEQVLVAARDIPIGTTIEADALRWQTWPQAGIAGTYLQRAQLANGIDDVVGTLARGLIYAGEPITLAKLARADGGFLAAILPAGMLAVATSISVETGAGGFILPNDRVDIIMTRATDGADGATRYITETILHNIRILAIDQAIEEQEGLPVVVGRTATLELTPQQAEILTVAQEIGDRLSLALRSLADANEVFGADADARHLIAGDTRAEGILLIRNGVARRIGITAATPVEAGP